MSEVVWTRRTDSELSAKIGYREYAIYRRDIPRGIYYRAWCDFRNEFAKRGPIHPGDREARIQAVTELKLECEKDAENG